MLKHHPNLLQMMWLKVLSCIEQPRQIKCDMKHPNRNQNLSPQGKIQLDNKEMTNEINCPRCGNGHCINYTMAGYVHYDRSTVPLSIN